MTIKYPLFTSRDLDGFFGLFVDNLVQLLLIVSLCSLCGIGADSALLTKAILPGAAISILLGNMFYAWQAHRLAKREERDDVTALPYGINTVSLLVFIFFVMKPVYDSAITKLELPPEKAAHLAWQMGLIACLGSGMIELAGSFVAEYIRKKTPRAALLSTLAGIAIGFIAMTFALQIFQKPLIAMLPLGIILVTYFSKMRFPFGLPGGFVAVVIGTSIAWGLTGLSSVWETAPDWITASTMNAPALKKSISQIQICLPQFAGEEIWSLLQDWQQWMGYLSVMIPMGLFSVVGSLQNIESAEAAGDRFDTRSALAVNGIGTIVAAMFGSCFPTTIYIGHPGWKGLGARAGYSSLNGIVITLICFTGTVTFFSQLIPMEAGIAIVLWIGIIMAAQAFQATPKEHAPAVAIGLFPAIAAWGWTVTHGAFIQLSFLSEGVATVQQVLVNNLRFEVNGFLLHGMMIMERGYIFTCMILAAIAAFLVDRKFMTAGIWSLIGATAAFIGLTHAYQIQGNAFDYLFVFITPSKEALMYRANDIAIGYLLFALLFFGCGWFVRKDKG